MTTNNSVKPEKETSFQLEQAKASRFKHFVQIFNPSMDAKAQEESIIVLDT